MRSRMVLISAVTAAVVGVLACDTDTIVRDLTPTLTGIAFTARVDSGATRPITDTIVTQDTVFVPGADTTVLHVRDTVLVPTSDTILVIGTDTIFVNALDTLTVTVTDTVFVPAGTDTVVVRGTDTIFVPTTEVRYDTVVVVEQVPVVPNVATSTSSLTLTVGQTVQLGATLENTLGLQATSSNITWRSFNPDVAAVTSSGLASGVDVGTTDLQARDTANGLFDELPVNVTAAQTIQTFSFSGSSGGGPHEPSTFGPITERDFSATSESGWWVYDPNGGFRIVQDVTAPTGGDALAARVLFPAGAEASSFGPPATGITFNPRPSEVYIALYHKFSANWQWHPSGANKTFRVIDDSSAGSGGSTPFTLQGTHNGQSVGGTYEYEGDVGITFGGDGDQTSFRFLTNNLATVRITAGQWAFIEIIMRHQKTPGGSDGEYHMWVNGTKTAEYTNVQYMPTDSQRSWSDTKWDPVWGGTGSTISQNMYQYVDHVYVSGR